MGLGPNLLGSGSGGLDAKGHRSVRLVQLCEKILGIHELAAVGLSDRLEEQALLLRRNAEWFPVVTENGHFSPSEKACPSTMIVPSVTVPVAIFTFVILLAAVS